MIGLPVHRGRGKSDNQRSVVNTFASILAASGLDLDRKDQSTILGFREWTAPFQRSEVPLPWVDSAP